jgi:peptidoglycan/xylan/chitin deacetylase (PgdA/CDA1 family)
VAVTTFRVLRQPPGRPGRARPLARFSPPRVAERLALRYGHARLGVTDAESRAYNTTDSVLLTFDDYAPVPRVLSILAVLRENQVRAAFFPVGLWAAEQPQVLTRIRDDGHWVGNHTLSHGNLRGMPVEQIRHQIHGGPSGWLLRPPRGYFGPETRTVAAELGYQLALWTVDSKDWTGRSAASIRARVLGNVHPGACVLLHLHAANTLRALPDLIDGIRRRGHTLCHEGTELSP